jgi:CRISPR-associated endonuclease Cas2
LSLIDSIICVSNTKERRLNSHYVIAYDVKNNKRRRKCAKVAYGYALGGQKSALESLFEKKELPVVLDELLDCIEPKEDRVHVVKVMPRAILLGRARQLHFDEGTIVV